MGVSRGRREAARLTETQGARTWHTNALVNSPSPET